MCREMLSASPVNADMALIRLSQGDSARLKANCARTLKNLTSDVNEAIGEGDVAALIAMSLEVIICFISPQYAFFDGIVVSRGKKEKLEMILVHLK